jgi:integrase
MPGLKVTQRDGFYHATGTVAGRRIRKSLGTRDEKIAAELCAQYEARLWKRHSYGEEAVRTFEEAAVRYQEAEGESRFLAPIIKRFRGCVLGKIQPEEIRQAARALYPHAKAATRNRQVIVPTRAVINHAAGLGWCSKIAVKSFPTEKARRRSVNRQWLDAFLARADEDGLHGLAAAVLFMWQTGARVSEAARILPEHVDLHERVVVLETTKTGQWEPCYITQEMMLRLANLSTEAGRPVFGYSSRFGITRRMKAVCRRAGVDFVSPHQAGRHSYATNALADGATIKEVMEGGRWKSARLVLETYAHAEHGGRAIADRFDTQLTRSLVSSSKPLK